MSRRRSAARKRNIMITTAIVVSVLLYLSGVFSGLYANKIIEKKTEEDISLLKNETTKRLADLRLGTEKQISSLSDYINFLERNLRTMQFEQVFADTLSDDEMCAFANVTLDYLFSELNFYWDVLPFRVEEYELSDDLSDEYLRLKHQYTQLSVRTWAIARNRNSRCNSSQILGLQFYTPRCTECVRQGEELDEFKRSMRSMGKDVIIFTVDKGSDEPIITFLVDYYSINSSSALFINNQVFQGRVFGADELEVAFR